MQQAKILHRDPLVLINKYYALKNTNPKLAAKFLKIITQKYPDFLDSLQIATKKSSSHYLLSLSGYQLSIFFWNSLMELNYTMPEKITIKPIVSVKLPKNIKPQRKLSVLQEINLPRPNTNLNTPYYAEILLTPFKQSRFALSVNQLLMRYGIEQKNKMNSREYIFLRRTADNRSRSLGQLTELYEDDAQIQGIGGQIRPVASLPIIAFLETGAAYDLIYQNRPRWRPDLRAGLMFYQEVGSSPDFFAHPTINCCYYANWYGEITYFTRYSNTIGGIRTNQGVRVLQYRNSMINLYFTGRIVFDTERLFFNNFVEYGPGLALVPNNHYNFAIRLESVRGIYLPAGTIPNPYAQGYRNNIVQLLFYMKL